MAEESQAEEVIFLAALTKATRAERAAYVEDACGGNAELRQRVEELLRCHEEPEGPLDAAPTGLVATIESPPIAERPGVTIGRYKLLQEIGEGGFGVVFMAEQEEPVRRKVALKIIKPGMDTKEVIARFEAERQALAIMDHPNIAKVLDGGATESGRPYFVMELVRGIPITAFCDQNGLTTRERLELFAAVCQAVQHAHQKGIIHRDIKPSNVLVTMHDDRPVPKVIDFGVAKATNARLTERTLFTRFAQMVGTPLYMSPEQAQMSGLDVDTRSDIYSLGVLLYELLTGTTPFDQKRIRAAAYDELLRIIREEEPLKPSLRISTLGDTLPSVAAQRKVEPKKLSALVRGELDWIVMKALEKDRSRRYETANGFAADIERYLSDEPVLACPPSAAYWLRKFARRNKRALVMASVVAMALMALITAGILVHRNQLAEQRRLSEQKAYEERLLAEKRQNALEKAMMAAMSGDFDGAEKAIAECELLGASTGQVRMLRGQVALHRGDAETAIPHLEQAVKLLPAGQPGAVAARALLALAHIDAQQVLQFDAVYRELELLSPRTPEDYLFKGHVEATILFGHERGLENLDEVIRWRPHSSVLRAVRIEARANRALDTGEVRDAELALEDAQVARAMLPGNVLVLARSVYADLVAAGIYEDRGRPEDRERVLAQARRDVQELGHFVPAPLAARACFEYFDYVGDEEAAYVMSQRGVVFREVVMLYRRREFDKALDAIERHVKLARANTMDWVERGLILTELPDGPARARAAYQDAKAHAESIWQVGPPMILLLLGRKDEAIQASLIIRANRSQMPARFRDWYFKYIDYNCALITADELLQAAGGSRRKGCEAHFAIGVRRLAEGDRAGGREHFRKCAATRVFIYWEYMWARAFLARMEKDPAWPPWIR